MTAKNVPPSRDDKSNTDRSSSGRANADRGESPTNRADDRLHAKGKTDDAVQGAYEQVGPPEGEDDEESESAGPLGNTDKNRENVDRRQQIQDIRGSKNAGPQGETSKQQKPEVTRQADKNRNEKTRESGS